MNTIDRYIIRQEIGRGGMSIVYRAYDPQFDREVAIKVLPKEFLHDPQYRKRFEREAKTMGALEHFSIVPLYDLGEVDGQPYIVFRYMQGGTLSDLIRKGPLSTQEVTNVVSRVASALDAAHARGIIHRDLKPSNVLLDQYGGVFLSDFGIARMTQPTHTTLTGSAIIGSPPYMSPEQIQGESEIDARSDIYSLGVILFEMLTGKPPFPADNPTQAIMAHLLEPIPNILDYRPDLPSSCQKVIEKALAKNRDERYDTAGELAIALQAALFGEINGVPLYLPGDTVKHKESNTLRKLFSLQFFLFIIGIFVISTIIVILAMNNALSVTLRSSTSINQNTDAIDNDKTRSSISAKNTIPSEPSEKSIPSMTYEPTLPTIPRQTAFPSESKITNEGDKIALLTSNDIWLVDTNGYLIKQLTNDKKIKFGLQWVNQDKQIKYISNNCVYFIDVNDLNKQPILCLSEDETINFFELTPNNKTIALGINEKLYIIPYDPQFLKNVKYRSDLLNISMCSSYTPYNYNLLSVTHALWSPNEDYLLAIIAKGKSKTNEEISTVQILRIDECSNKLFVLDQFPFVLTEEYKVLEDKYQIENTPGYGYTIIQDLSWSTKDIFGFVGQKKDNGYGDLYFYYYKIKAMEKRVNPIDGTCCYKSPKWSADGKYLSFFFQDEREKANSTPQFFYLPYSTIGTGIKYTPEPLNLIDGVVNPFEAVQIDITKSKQREN